MLISLKLQSLGESNVAIVYYLFDCIIISNNRSKSTLTWRYCHMRVELGKLILIVYNDGVHTIIMVLTGSATG